jgi:hypothetical protein
MNADATNEGSESDHGRGLQRMRRGGEEKNEIRGDRERERYRPGTREEEQRMAQWSVSQPQRGIKSRCMHMQHTGRARAAAVISAVIATVIAAVIATVV